MKTETKIKALRKKEKELVDKARKELVGRVSDETLKKIQEPIDKVREEIEEIRQINKKHYPPAFLIEAFEAFVCQDEDAMLELLVDAVFGIDPTEWVMKRMQNSKDIISDYLCEGLNEQGHDVPSGSTYAQAVRAVWNSCHPPSKRI